ncbi:MAG TPA: hypothetical protein VF245_05985 [Solirubrobacterales bacterium]
MPHPTIKITSDQRDAIYAQVRNHLAALGDVFTAMELQDDILTAERMGRQFSQDFRLLEDIGWREDDGRDQVELTMPCADLAALMTRLREEAQGGLADALKEREEVAGDEIIADLESTMRACDAVLVYLDSGYGEPA